MRDDVSLSLCGNKPSADSMLKRARIVSFNLICFSLNCVLDLSLIDCIIFYFGITHSFIAAEQGCEVMPALLNSLACDQDQSNTFYSRP